MSVKTTRPDLSFITNQKFENYKDYVEWQNSLSKEQKKILFNMQMLSIPNLITCAEMLFDANVGNPESIVFKIVSETLNGK